MKTAEIELTFLAKKIPPEIDSVTPKRLADIYLPEDSPFPVVRLRQRGDEYEITKKIPVTKGDFSSHTEHTIPLSRAEFEALCGASKRSVKKDRYAVKIEGAMAEVDIFLDELAGLVMVDFEFESEQQKKAFAMPDWLLADVTQERFVLGGQLAGKTYSDVEDELVRFKYQRLSL